MKSALARFANRLLTALDLLCFVGGRRPWLLPVLVCLLLLSGFVVLAQASQIAPFIYTIF